jgi:hypothetical protein
MFTSSLDVWNVPASYNFGGGNTSAAEAKFDSEKEEI